MSVLNLEILGIRIRTAGQDDKFEVNEGNELEQEPEEVGLEWNEKKVN